MKLFSSIVAFAFFAVVLAQTTEQNQSTQSTSQQMVNSSRPSQTPVAPTSSGSVIVNASAPISSGNSTASASGNSTQSNLPATTTFSVSPTSSTTSFSSLSIDPNATPTPFQFSASQLLSVEQPGFIGLLLGGTVIGILGFL